MTPVQILLTNGLYDVSQLSIPSDNVDPESLLKPRHWNINFIKNYMVFFGPLSSLFDFATFGVMLYIFHARGPLFQTGWFIESIATEILVVFVIRTARTPFFFSRPGKWLLITCLSLTLIGMLLPFTPLAGTNLPEAEALSGMEIRDVAGNNLHQHMHHAKFTFIDANHHIQEWTFMLGDKTVHAHFDLQRKADASAAASK